VITIFLRDVIGGVTSYWENLIQQLPFEVYVVFTKNVADHSESASPLFDQCGKGVVTYDPTLENKHAIYRRMLSSIPNETSLVIANDRLELEALYISTKPHKVALVVHGDYSYYYDIAVAFRSIIVSYLCVSESIARNLKRRFDGLNVKPSVQHLPPISPSFGENVPNTSSPIRVLFVGRITALKGADDVYSVIDSLLSLDMDIRFTIVSSSSSMEAGFSTINDDRVKFFTALSREEMFGVFRENDVFLLPSREEGFPVSLLEAMSAGLVPIVSKIDAFSFVRDDVDGFKISSGRPKEIVDKLISLNTDRRDLLEKRDSCLAYRDRMPNNSEIVSLVNFLHDERSGKAELVASNREKIHPWLDRLDQPYLPNMLVILLRRIRRGIRSSGLFTLISRRL
jgi:glycosyltransferase involved in cell wall biosynthesis